MSPKMKFRVAVYGSLRKGLYNHDILTRRNAVYIGEFRSEPVYTMFSLGGFPGLNKHGSTSITFEVYDVTFEGLEALDRLEGYDPENIFDDGLYTREIIKTPFKNCFLYIYNNKGIDSTNVSLNIVESGDWKDYLEEIKKIKCEC